jgi:hypothetical protein
MTTGNCPLAIEIWRDCRLNGQPPDPINSMPARSAIAPPATRIHPSTTHRPASLSYDMARGWLRCQRKSRSKLSAISMNAAAPATSGNSFSALHCRESHSG